ncbi:MAG TPA: hypothetical protein VHM24_00090 [Gemmatimonadaceae bacterium]|nr:hypothetical protein [Gemmatimonadaceae bacterium]
MENSENTTAHRWGSPLTAKEKNAAQRAVNALLDALAPERVLKRADVTRGPIEQHRTPSGCVLQGQGAAVSVSWFVDSRSQATLGELHVNVWRGVVSRGGSSYRKPESATVVSELVLVPIAKPSDDCIWRASNGTEYDTAALAAHCVALLQEQIAAVG